MKRILPMVFAFLMIANEACAFWADLHQRMQTLRTPPVSSKLQSS